MSGEPNTFSVPNDRVLHIDIKIKKINQLFNSFDPSPFLEKDLDDDAFEYIVSSISEHPIKTKQKIVIHIPHNQRSKISEIEIKRGIHNFFEYKKMIAQRSIKSKIKEGQFSFLIGIIFLVACTLFSEYVSLHAHSIGMKIIAEGLLIGGWVAMWKPISDLLYEWWPIWKDKRVYHKISQMDIEFRYTD